MKRKKNQAHKIAMLQGYFERSIDIHNFLFSTLSYSTLQDQSIPDRL